MVTKVVPGLLIATADHDEVAREACARIVRGLRAGLRERGTATLALSGGSSPGATYRLLSRENIDWSRIHVFWVDERAVPADHARSNYNAAREALLDAITIPEDHVHRMRGEADDIEGEAKRYATLLRDTIAPKASGVPVLDVAVLGVGTDGHTASLFPGEPTVAITDRLVAAVPARPDREARLTLTVPVLENAKSSVWIVLGADKHEPLERVWATAGDLTLTPARIVRGFRGAVTWVIDRAAGGIG